MPRGGKRAGAGRPPSGTKEVKLRLTPEAKTKLKDLAVKYRTSMSAIAERLIIGASQEGVNDHETDR